MVGIGDVLGDKYRVERLLGRGGRGYVVAARHEQLDQQVAIKILMPELCESEDAVARFLREARASVPFQSEHVARVLDVGTLDDGAPFMVMEFLEGCDLAHELDERLTLPISEAVDYVLQACEALAEAHTLGIAHRALKPANLFRMRRPDGSALIKVLGFGISKASPTDGEGLSLMHLTATEGSVDSPYYMSPEQVRSPETMNTRSDIWSLGIVLCELLTGYPPRLSDNPMSLLAAVVTEDPRERENASVGLQDIILKCLERDASRRYADVSELADALQVYTPTGAAAVERIFAIVRSVKERSLGGHEGSRPAMDDPTLESAAYPPADAHPLESPRLKVEILEGGGYTDAEWIPSHTQIVRSRWMAVLLGAAIPVGGALLFRTYVARSPIADSLAASSAAPSSAPSIVARSVVSASGGSETSRGQDAAIDPASDPLSIATKRAAPLRAVGVENRHPILADAKKHSPVKAPAERPAVPPKTPVPVPPPLDSELDPLDGRF